MIPLVGLQGLFLEVCGPAGVLSAFPLPQRLCICVYFWGGASPAAEFGEEQGWYQPPCFFSLFCKFPDL